MVASIDNEDGVAGVNEDAPRRIQAISSDTGTISTSDLFGSKKETGRSEANDRSSYEKSNGIVVRNPSRDTMVTRFRDEDVQIRIDEESVTDADLIQGRSRTTTVDHHGAQGFRRCPTNNAVIRGVKNEHRSVRRHMDTVGIVQLRSSRSRSA